MTFARPSHAIDGDTTMSVTLVYDDGQQSRYPRYRIPATVEIDNWRYPVQEWSVEGFAVAGVQNASSLGSGFPVKLWFRFDGFSTVVDANAEVVRHDRADDSILCRFMDLSSQKLSVLRAVIDSYLLGEFVSVEDLIGVIKRDVADETKDERARAPMETGEQRVRELIRRWLGLAMVSALLAFLVGLSLWIGYRRLYVVEAASAVVSAPLVILRAPQHSFFKAIGGPDVTRVKRGQAVAYTELVGGGATTIESPCDCRILQRHVLQGEFVSVGEPLMTLLPMGEKAYVSVQVRVEDARRITLGDRATVTLPDRSTVEGTVQRVLYGEPLARQLATPLSRASADVISYHEVIVAPDKDLDLDLLGVPATVEVNTFRGI